MKKLLLILLIVAFVVLGYGIVSWQFLKQPTFFSVKKDCAKNIEEYFTKKGEEELNKKSADEWEKELRNTPPGQNPWGTPSQGDMQDMMKEANQSNQPSGPWEQVFGYQCQSQ